MSKKRKAKGAAMAAPATVEAPAKPRLTEEQLSRRARRALRDRDIVAAAVRRFDIDALADLERRAGSSSVDLEEGPGVALRDGYPTSVRNDPGGRGGARRCIDPDCAEVAIPGRLRCDEHSTGDDEADELLPPPPYADSPGELVASAQAIADPIPAEVRRCFVELALLAKLARRVEARLGRLQRNALAGRDLSVGICQACEATVTGLGHDRLRGGFCPACARSWERCRSAWVGPGAPDRVAFIRQRQEAKAS